MPMKRNLFKFFCNILTRCSHGDIFCPFENEEMSCTFVLIICPSIGYLFNMIPYEDKD